MNSIKKLPINKKYLEISIYILVIVFAVVSFEYILNNFSVILTSIKNVWSFITTVLSPFIYALFIGYLLNTPMRNFEEHILKRFTFFKKRLKLARVTSLVTTYLILIGCLVWIVAYLFPEIYNSFNRMAMTVPKQLDDFKYMYETQWGNDSPVEVLTKMINQAFSQKYSPEDIINFAVEPFQKLINELPGMLSKLYLGTLAFVNSTIQFIIGLVIAFYGLLEKETLVSVSKKVIYVMFRKDKAQVILDTAIDTNRIFESFLIGKIIDSTIIGIMFFIICLILKLPYPALLSVVVGVTNMIPYFGPFIGAIPVIVIVFLNNPGDLQTVWAGLAILALQQFDGLFLGPKILGDCTGLKPMGVIFAIVVGGALFGVLGMFFGVPIFAAIKNIVSEIFNRKYEKKIIEGEH